MFIATKMKWRYRVLVVTSLSIIPFMLLLFSTKAKVEPSIINEYGQNNNPYRKDRGGNSNLKFEPQHADTSGVDEEEVHTFEFLDTIANGDQKSASVEGKPELHVIVFNHAHTDPGWYWTMEEYYNMKAKNILDHLVIKLDQYRNMTFVWAETVFLAKWWEQQGTETRNKFMNFIRRKQLEIVSGGWVLPDEATSHYFSLINQFADGHHWLKDNLGVVPKNVWSIDPFGYSSTLAYLRKQAGFNNMVIDRVDSSVKEIMWERKMLEFNWRQPWDRDRTTDIVTHVMPYFSYTTMHSCGPDFEWCRSMHYQDHAIKKTDVAGQAGRLVEQLRKKALLFRHNTLFMMVGRDFGFDNLPEWENQYNSYSAIMDFINKNKAWNVNIRYGILDDYFTQMKANSENKPITDSLPAIRGDFIPYHDKKLDYWTGYFTSRPYHKRLSRQTQEVFRAANAMTSLILDDIQTQNPILLKEMSNLLQRSSYNISLFQHHDAITGTSSSANMRDYRQRLEDALSSSQTVLENSIEFISTGKQYHKTSADNQLNTIAVVNASPKRRSEVVSYVVKSGDVSITNYARSTVKCQISQFDKSLSSYSTDYVIHFKAEAHPYESSFYTVSDAKQPSTCYAAETESRSSETRKTAVVMENKYLDIKFFPDDRLEICLAQKDNVCVDISFSWHFYKPGEGTGAYILRDLGNENKQLQTPATIKIVKGVLFSEIQLTYKSVKQHFRIYHDDGSAAQSVEIWTAYDISKLSDTELILRLSTSIKNNNREFHTDSNGYQILRRKYRTGLPICANFYPMTSSMVIEDSKQRLTLHSGQSHSVSSMEVGSIDVLLDRRMSMADDKGMGQGITDNIETTSTLILQLEKVEQQTPASVEDNIRPSFAAMVTNDFLQNPLLVFKFLTSGKAIPPKQLFHSSEFPCNMEIAHMKLIPDTETGKFGIGLTFHNRETDPNFHSPDFNLQCSNNDKVIINNLFTNVQPTSIYRTTMTYLELIEKIKDNEEISIRPMEMASFYIRL